MIKPEEIFDLTSDTFEELALRVFAFQYEKNAVYRAFCDSLKKTPDNVHSLQQVPYLPIQFFKSHDVIVEGYTPEIRFESSGTTGAMPSRHLVADTQLYRQSFTRGFEHFYGPVNGYVILALLPSYLERRNSSLVYMAEELIKRSGQNASGFFLNQYEKLYDLLDVLKTTKRKTILLGVTFALIDFTIQYKIDFPQLIVMETGGMKGRMKEITREEVHTILRTGFDVEHIHSEYGMTELLSQAYSKGDGYFEAPPWMKINIRDLYEPQQLLQHGQTGGVNVIDLANLYSCSFVATDDIGQTFYNGSFKILGRSDNAELRGCNLMMLD